MSSLSFSLKAQDTISYSIDKAEEVFLKKNLILLASKYNIEKQNALILQSKLFPNPVIYANFNVYDPENDLYFHTGPTGQKDFMFEQLINLGGKRKTLIDIAKTNKEVAEAEFSDLLRNLKFQLNRSFYSIHQHRSIILKFNTQLLVLDTLIQAYELQAQKGNLSLKDVIRLKSVYLRINNEKAQSIQLLNEETKNMHLLLQEQGFFLPQIAEGSLDGFSKAVIINDLETAALNNRPDLLIDSKLLQLSELSYKLQRKAIIPDATFNVSTDQRGGAFKNQINAGVALPLPLWNYNKGNTKAAKNQIQINTYLLEERKAEVRAEVFEAYQNMVRSVEEYEKSKKLYNSSFETVFKSVNENFSKKNLSIIEFVDFFESYNDALRELERIKSQIAISAAKINYVTAQKFY